MCKLNPLCKARPCDCGEFDAQLAAEGLGHLDTAHWLESPETGESEPAIGVSNRGSGKPRDGDDTLRSRDEGAELLEEAGDILRGYRFANATERAVWTVYARGEGMKGAARELGISFRQARKIVLDVQARWRSRARQAVRLTPGRIRRADPGFLLKLLEAL